MIQRTTRQSLIAIPAIAAIFFFLADWIFPIKVLLGGGISNGVMEQAEKLRGAFNVVLGGGISLFSFRTVAWSVRKFLGMQMAQAAIMGISILKVTLIFFLLAILAYFKLVSPIPLMVGFVVVLAIVIKEGFIAAGKAGNS
jgi:F0F1-type ATP synthase assembly protein I